MKLHALTILTAFLVAGFSVASLVQQADTRGRLEAENRELRLRDSARARVKQFARGGVTVNMDAVENAAYDMGTPASIVEAMRRQENGSPLWELGHKGKTAFIAGCVAPDHWQYYEASRTANRALWRWALEYHRKEAIKALGKAYTAKAHAARWARNVTELQGEAE